MNIWEIFQFNNARANKDQSGRSFTVDQFNYILEGIDIDYLKLKYGLPEEYKPGAPLPRQAWEVTQKITDDLRHLKKILGGRDFPLLAVDKYGYADIPSDYVHQSSLRWDQTLNAPDCKSENELNQIPIEVLTDADFDGRLYDSIRVPWTKYPFCKFNNSYIEFKPANIQFVVFSYISMPISAYLAVTVDNNNDYVYDPVNSRDLEWPIDMHMDIANRIYMYLADNLSNPLMAQSGAKKLTEGI